MTSPFRTNYRQHSVNVTMPLTRRTADTTLLMRAAETASRRQFKAGFRYARAGAALTYLQQAGHDQGELDLFSTVDEPAEALPDPRSKRMAAMDALNNRYGRDSVRLGSTAMATNCAKIAVSAAKQERRSPRYTTIWNEMPVVRA